MFKDWVDGAVAGCMVALNKPVHVNPPQLHYFNACSFSFTDHPLFLSLAFLICLFFPQLKLFFFLTFPSFSILHPHCSGRNV